MSKKDNYFGDKLLEYITSNNLTNAEVAKKLGLHRSAITKYINGERSIKLTELKPFAQKLGVPPQYFVPNSVLSDNSLNQEITELERAIKLIKLSDIDINVAENLSPEEIIEFVNTWISVGKTLYKEKRN